jgi:hypothetical protein
MTFAYPTWHWSRVPKLWSQADELEAQYGLEAALLVIDERLAKAPRRSRRHHLYLLRDEIVRRAAKRD